MATPSKVPLSIAAEVGAEGKERGKGLRLHGTLLSLVLRQRTMSHSAARQELLDVLQEELDLARAGEREASLLLGSAGSKTTSGQAA